MVPEQRGLVHAPRSSGPEGGEERRGGAGLGVPGTPHPSPAAPARAASPPRVPLLPPLAALRSPARLSAGGRRGPAGSGGPAPRWPAAARAGTPPPGCRCGLGSARPARGPPVWPPRPSAGIAATCLRLAAPARDQSPQPSLLHSHATSRCLGFEIFRRQV